MLESVLGRSLLLICLWEKDSLTQKQLVAQLAIEQATIANTLNRMERGKVEQEAHQVNALALRSFQNDGKGIATRRCCFLFCP